MPKAYGSTRVSTSEQGESGLSLDAQQAAIEATACRLNLPLAHVYSDVGLSGALGIEARPGLFAAIGELRRGDVLICAKRDRIARDPLVMAMVEKLVARKGARLVSAAGEGGDGDDPTSVLTRRMLDAFSEFERLIIGARTKAALKAKRARGERAGNTPFGHRALPDGRLESEPREQEAMAIVRELRARGLSERAIVAALRGRVVGRTGLPLGQVQVHRILKARSA